MVNDITSTLPKPITMTGSAFEDKTKKVKKVEETKIIVEESKDDEQEMVELPMPVVFGDDSTDDSNNPTTVNNTSNNTSNDDNEEEKPLEIEVPEDLNDEKKEEKAVEFKIPIKSKTEEKEDEVPELVLNDDSDDEDPIEKSEVVEAPQTSVNTLSTYDEPEEISEEENKTKPNVEPEAVEEDEDEESNFVIPKLDNTVSLAAKRDDVANDLKVIEGQTNFRPPTVPAGINNNSAFSSPISPMQQQMQPVNNMGQEKSGGVPKVILGILGVFIGGGLVVGGYFTANKIFNKGEEKIAQQAVSEPVVTPTQVPTTPTPVTQTPKPVEKEVVEEKDLEEATNDTVKKEDLTIKILNGSGEKGVAKVVRALLVEEGFIDIKTGNADNFDYKKSYISYKPEYEDFITEISAALKSKYTLIKDEELKTSDDYDFYIIIGPEESTKIDKTLE